MANDTRRPSSLPIYYINLEARPDRRAFMEQQFADLGLSAERIVAATPDQLSAADLEASCNPDRREYLRPTELCCSLSHEAAWQAFLSGPHTHAVVLEDDALLSRQLPDFLAALGEPGFGLIRIETTERRLRILPAVRQVLPGVSLHPFRSTEAGSAGYIISRPIAELMLRLRPHRRLHIDLALYCPFRSPVPAGERVLTDPGLCIQLGNQDRSRTGAAASDIDTGQAGSHRFPRQHPWSVRTSNAAYRLRKTVDHLAYLPRGLTRRSIPFLA